MIKSTEVELHAKWLVNGPLIELDTVGKRILFLIDNVLRQVAADSTGWDKLYRDSSDGRFWELMYLQSHLHGGGPPSLIHISESDARKKYTF
jgi:hypothetical protein